MLKIRSFLSSTIFKENEIVLECKLADFQEFSVWENVCDELLAKPFPPQISGSDFLAEAIERGKRVSFAKLSNWEIICEEIVDKEDPHVHYQKCYDELRNRGKSEQETLEMRKLAWYAVGWLNFPMAMWEWVSLDEADIRRAINWLYDKKQISEKQRIEFEDCVKLHE